jgi:hypothetical protein
LEEDIVRSLKMVVIGLGAVLWLPMAAQGAEDAGEPATQDAAPGTEKQAAAPKCLEAAVNPVTGHALCINPRGAPVDPPPAEALNKPCKPRAHDDDPFTVYERYSACD